MLAINPGLYQHYKGPFYDVIEVAQHSETEEPLVIYRALYGEKGLWARPLSMFTETIDVDGQMTPRFAFCDPQTGVLEVAILDVNFDEKNDFETAFKQVEALIQDTKGYISHQLNPCVKSSNRYILLVNWQSLEASNTDELHETENHPYWRKLIHRFYDPLSKVGHYSVV